MSIMLTITTFNCAKSFYLTRREFARLLLHSLHLYLIMPISHCSILMIVNLLFMAAVQAKNEASKCEMS